MPLALFACLALITTCTLSADTFTFTSPGTAGANDETVGAADTPLNTSNMPTGYLLPPVSTTVSNGTYCNPCTFTLTSGVLQAPLINGGANYQNQSAPYDYQIPYSTTGGTFTLTNMTGTVFSGTFVPSSIVLDAHNGVGGLQGFVGNTMIGPDVSVSGTFGPGAGALDGFGAGPGSFLMLSFNSFRVFNWSAAYPGGGASATYNAVISDATSGVLESELVLNPVPEPSSMMLIGSGLIGLAFLRRRIFNR
jgi:hypothetical protein